MNNEQKKSTIERIFEKNAFAIVLAVISAITAVANLWTVSKLAPVTQDLAVIANRVEAVEHTSATIVPRSEYDFTINAITDMMMGWKEDTNKRLDRIEGKIDEL